MPKRRYLDTQKPSAVAGKGNTVTSTRLQREAAWRKREGNIAKSLISRPTLSNLISAVKHYANSVPGLVSAPSEITGVIAGEPLLPSIKNVAYLSKVGSISKAIDEGAKEFASWEKAIANKDKIYNFANDLINIGNKRWNALINSEEYVNRINNNLRIDDIKDAYKAAKTIRRNYKSLPYDHNEWWSPYRGWTQEQYLEEINKQASLKASKRINLENIKPNSEDIRKSIASVPIDDNIILQDRIQYLDDKGNLITKPDTYTGGYMAKTDKTHIKVDAPDIISTTIHEGGGHRVYRKTSYLNRNILNTPNIKLRFDYDEPFAKYYRNLDELRARTLPILANMHNKGYKLNYKGFLDYMKDNNIHISDSPLHPYDDNTIRHAINLIFGGTGIYVGNKIIEKDIKNDVNRRSLASGGSIYIKPSHRGRLTELKARTGKSEA